MTRENRLKSSDVEFQLELRKRSRAPRDTIATYIPKWVVLSSHGLACPAPTPAKEIGPDLCRRLMSPSDVPSYAAVDPVTVCTEMMALLSMVSILHF